MTITASRTRLVVDALPPETVSVDVAFDGVRVWSVDVRRAGSVEPADEASAAAGAGALSLEWPPALRPYLVGSTRLSISDSGSGSELAAGDVAFDDTGVRTRVVDDAGGALVVNKWGRLGVALSAMDEDTRRLIIERSARLVALLQELGLRPFVVGGTLLGGVRDGALLPHDDDADIAYLSRHSSPADVAIEAFRVGRELQARGYELRRHSATHMQLIFRDARGDLAHYIDVFAAFFTPDGMINQPFHVRGAMREDQMLPFGSVEIDGVAFPAPADVDRWLTINYDEHWREPIPGFELVTPEETRRRFDDWFGGFNFQREFWDDRYAHAAAAARDAVWDAGAGWIVAQHPQSPTVLDLGAGSGRLTAALLRSGAAERVVACDYSEPAMRILQSAIASPRLETAHLNLYRLTSLGLPARLGIEGAFDAVANHLLEQIGHLGRANALRMFRMALRSGGSALATFAQEPAPGVSRDDPTGWHLDRLQLTREAAELGMDVEFTALPAGAEDRPASGARFSLSPRPYPRKDVSMKQRLKRILLRTTQSSTRAELETLRARVTELESELDEVRRDSIRIAELIDLAEQTLTPNTDDPDSDRKAIR